jgi:predicted DNA-binding transcriptional regulator YafY
VTTYGITDPNQAVTIDYTNWRGERAVRQVVPWELVWGSNEWHPAEQWLLRAYDVAKKETRTFAMVGIHSWQKQSQG